MGLKSDIEDAFVKSLGIDTDTKGNIPELAQDITDAIVDFLTKQTFTITEMKAVLEVEEIKTVAPLQADVLPTVTIVNGFGPGNVLQGTKGVLIPKLNLGKTGGQGGVLQSTGHAYIGRNPAPGNETNEDLTKVKLLDENIVGK